MFCHCVHRSLPYLLFVVAESGAAQKQISLPEGADEPTTQIGTTKPG